MTEQVILSYHMKRQCGNARPWKLHCPNAFKADDVSQFACRDQPPDIICSVPGLAGPRVICEVAEIDVILPAVLLASLDLHDCPCASPSEAFPLAMTAVAEEDLLSGQVARWESKWFYWAEEGPGDCRGWVIGLPSSSDKPAQILPVKLQYVIGAGCPGSAACWQSCLQLVVNNIDRFDSPYCFPDTGLMVHTFGTKAISTIDDLVPLTISGIIAAFGICGGSLSSVFAVCGYSPAGDYNVNAYPDHFGTITITEPAVS